ncbi:MAG TPA: zinc-ribbon domain-containing protein [Aquabacterium sp.]|uniref:zinc-ribbon domain-containing protein n=1 Tax=Aquabacterium sp. TaxID=1872578 RepID=UPI002E323999|nr:zinc-ribbon domain-containing protein [Aquabacterium sp.]HEX5372811.1 zinc-ribbon domain-containing protein [Aquabacterium sp.]
MAFVDTPRDEHDRALMVLLAQAEQEDLSLLVDYLTAHGQQRASHSDARSVLLQAQAAHAYSLQVLDTMLAELKRFGDNNILKLFRRGEGPAYIDIVRDVARHFKVAFSEADGVDLLEARILDQLMGQAWDKMTDAERAEFNIGLGHVDSAGSAALAGARVALQVGGFAAYRLALFAANSLARSLTGRGLTATTHAALHRTVRALSGPVAWAVSAAWTAFDLASPAYRVTVPCVVQIAYMRQKQSLHICPACESPNEKTARFCSQCGAALSHPVAP